MPRQSSPTTCKYYIFRLVSMTNYNSLQTTISSIFKSISMSNEGQNRSKSWQLATAAALSV